MLEFGARITRAEHVADLLELERGLERHGILELPPHEKHAVGVGVFFSHRRKVRVHLQHTRDFLRQLLELLDDAQAVGAGKIPYAAHEDGQQREDGDLGRERLGRGHADLRARMHVYTAVALAGDGAGHVVADA